MASYTKKDCECIRELTRNLIKKQTTETIAKQRKVRMPQRLLNVASHHIPTHLSKDFGNNSSGGACSKKAFFTTTSYSPLTRQSYYFLDLEEWMELHL